MTTRPEQDALGAMDIPADAYWGIHTQRAYANFPYRGQAVPAALIRAFAVVKKSAALANAELGYLAPGKAEAMVRACDEIADGGLADQFPLDALQGGAGTSTNMNVNEVIANRAIEILKGRKGDYAMVHPLQDVNLHQSTNDVYPTALKVAAVTRLRGLSPKVAALQGAFQKKEKEFAAVVKLGRTEMQGAVPITSGVEFSAFAEAFSRDRWRAFKCEERLRVVNLGGTSVGTGLSAPRSYVFLVVEKLRGLTGLGLTRAENAVDATANNDPFVEVSGILKAHAANLIKVSQDLRLLALLGEIRWPKKQAGSSAMPGKINPVTLESVIQAGMKTIANDQIVTGCVARGSLQINEFLPLLALALLETFDLLSTADDMLARDIVQVTADPDRCAYYLERAETLATAFVPEVGYDRVTELLQEFSGRDQDNLREFLEEKLGADRVARALDPHNLTAMGYRDDAHNT